MIEPQFIVHHSQVHAYLKSGAIQGSNIFWMQKSHITHGLSFHEQVLPPRVGPLRLQSKIHHAQNHTQLSSSSEHPADDRRSGGLVLCSLVL